MLEVTEIVVVASRSLLYEMMRALRFGRIRKTLYHSSAQHLSTSTGQPALDPHCWTSK
jgi:hypothetical protein